MQLHRAAAAAVFTLSLFLLPAAGHNITQILEKSTNLSTFNNYLTQTGLAAEINRRNTITVLAVDNAAMDVLTSKNYGLGTVKNLLSFLVLLDYYDAPKLHDITNGSALSTTLYQTTGLAPGSSGFINITILSHGKVGFWPDGLPSVNATFVKQIHAARYNISVIQISDVLLVPEAEAPAPEPAPANLTASMLGGCKVFAETLAAEKPAQQAFDGNVVSGLTILCPGDAAMRAFLPTYKNLSDEGKQSLLEYHGVPLYLTMQDFGSGKKMNTLATDQGKSNYAFVVGNNDGDKNVTINSTIVTASVVATLPAGSSLQQFAIYQLDKVLLPVELFNKSGLAPAPGPAGSPSPSPEQMSPPAPPPPGTDTDTPAPGPDGDAADTEGKRNGAAGFKVGGFGALVFSLFLCYL